MPDAGVRWGLTCLTCGLTRTFASQNDRDEYATVHAQCDVELFRLLTR